MSVIDRVNARAARASKTSLEEQFISIYEVVEAITEELLKTNKDLITQITLNEIPETALEMAIIKIISKFNYGLVGKDREELVKEVLDHVFRHGVIQKLLDMPGCNGVFINGPDNVWAKIGNQMIRTDINFGSIKNLLSFVYTLKAKLRGEINENIPLATLEDPKQKLRIICCIAPIAHVSPTIVFRKHNGKAFTLGDLVAMGMMTKELAEDLNAYNQAGANIIVSGKGGAGKTTLMRALLEELDIRVRILTMEEQAEFYLKHPNAMQLLTKRNDWGGQSFNLEYISEMGNKMTIDRYVYGELRSGEAMSFFHGAFSGNVTMTSLHALNAKNAILKAMVMMKMSGTNLSDRVLLDMLHEATNIIIHIDNFVVTEVVEVVKTVEKVEYNTLWEFEVERREITFLQGKHKKVGQIRSDAMRDKLRTWKGGQEYAF